MSLKCDDRLSTTTTTHILVDISVSGETVFKHIVTTTYFPSKLLYMTWRRRRWWSTLWLFLIIPLFLPFFFPSMILKIFVKILFLNF